MAPPQSRIRPYCIRPTSLDPCFDAHSFDEPVSTSSECALTTPGNVASAASIIREAIAAGETFRAHSFESACARNTIVHRLTKQRHPWTNGQVERMNRTIKDATVKRYHYNRHAQLRAIWPTSSAPTTLAAA